MSCSKCGKCCKFLDFTVGKPVEQIAKELGMSLVDLVRYYDYRGVQIIKYESHTTFSVTAECKNLGEDNQCLIWETRPSICKNTKDNPSVSKPAGCTD